MSKILLSSPILTDLCSMFECDGYSRILTIQDNNENFDYISFVKNYYLSVVENSYDLEIEEDKNIVSNMKNLYIEQTFKDPIKIKELLELNEKIEKTDVLYILTSNKKSDIEIANLVSQNSDFCISIICMLSNDNTNLETLNNNSDITIVIPKHQIFNNLNDKSNNNLLNNTIATYLSNIFISITNTFISNNTNAFSLCIHDLQSALVHENGWCYYGIGGYKGLNEAMNATLNAINTQCVKENISKSKGVLVHFIHNEEYPITKISEAMNYIEELANEEAYVIFSTTAIRDIGKDEIYVNIIV